MTVPPSHCIDIQRIHTTPGGAQRIMRNLNLGQKDVVQWCRDVTQRAPTNAIVRRGKNYYVYGNGFVLTIHATSHTVITAHKN